MMKRFFLITPFKCDPDFESKKAIISKLAEEHGMVLLMADEELVKSGQYVSGSLEMIIKADFVIADLSYERPSCYYELGYLQAMNKRVYLLAMQNTIIHQLLKPEKLIFYDDLNAYFKNVAYIMTIETTVKSQVAIV
jgi:nucleoside 2-deoxyribosyltransferase